VLYVALLSCSLCSVKLHVVILFVEQIKKEGRKGTNENDENSTDKSVSLCEL